MKRFGSVILVFLALSSVHVSAADAEKITPTPGGLVNMTATVMPKVSKALERAVVLKIARQCARVVDYLESSRVADEKILHLNLWCHELNPYVKKTAFAMINPVINVWIHIRGFAHGAFLAADNACIRCALGNNNVTGLIKQKIGASITEIFSPLLVFSENDFFMLGMLGLNGFNVQWIMAHKMICSMKTATLEVLLEHYPEYTDEVRQIIGLVAETEADSNYDALVVLANTFSLEVGSSTRQEALLKAIKACFEFKKSKSVSQEVTEVNG